MKLNLEETWLTRTIEYLEELKDIYRTIDEDEENIVELIEYLQKKTKMKLKKSKIYNKVYIVGDNNFILVFFL